MSILEKYMKVFNEKDEAGMNEIIHDDFKFTMHSSGNVLSKSDVIGWAMSDDINDDKSRDFWKSLFSGLNIISVKLPTIIIPEIALVTLIRGVCRAGVTAQTTK